MRDYRGGERGHTAGYTRSVGIDGRNSDSREDGTKAAVATIGRDVESAREQLSVIETTEDRYVYDRAKRDARALIASARDVLAKSERSPSRDREAVLAPFRAALTDLAANIEAGIAERDAAIAEHLAARSTGFARLLVTARIPPRTRPATVDPATLHTDATGPAHGQQTAAAPTAGTPNVDEGTPWTPVVVTVRKRDGHVKVWRGVSDAIGPLRVVGIAGDGGAIDWGDAGEYDGFRLYANKGADKFKTVATFAGKDAHSIIISIGIDVDVEGGTSNEDSTDAGGATSSGARPHIDDRPGIAGGAQHGDGEARSWQDQPWADKRIKIGKRGDSAREGDERGADVPRRKGTTNNPAGRTRGGKDRPGDTVDGTSRARGGGHNDEVEQDSTDRSYERVPEGHAGDDYKTRDNAREDGIVGGDGKDGRGVPQGSDLLKWLEFPRDIAILLTLGLILSDADIAGIGDGVVKKAIKAGLPRAALKQEIKKTISKQVAERVDELVDRFMKEAPDVWERASNAERKDIVRQTTEAVEEEAYRQLQEQIHREADRFAAWAAASSKDAAANRSDDMLVEIAADDAINAARVNEARAAIDELAPAPRTADEPYNPRAARRELERQHPGKVEGTVPPENAKNARKAGDRHEETGVVFDPRGYPVFDDVAAFETRLSSATAKVRDRQVHMREATRQLREAIEAGQVPKGRFNAKALADIKAGRAQIDGWRWHHHQERGRMQLVPAELHDRTGHTGGFETWYGGGDE